MNEAMVKLQNKQSSLYICNIMKPSLSTYIYIYTHTYIYIYIYIYLYVSVNAQAHMFAQMSQAVSEGLSIAAACGEC